MTELGKMKRVWAGTHKGIPIEVVNWNNTDAKPDGIWNFYLTIRDVQVSPDFFDDIWLPAGTSYWGMNYLTDIPWHGEMTFYEKRMDPDTGARTVKAGCDYNHPYDEGAIYSVTGVWRDAVAAAEALASMPRVGIKYRCLWTGKYYAPSEGEINEHGNWGSFEGIAAKAAFRQNNPG